VREIVSLSRGLHYPHPVAGRAGPVGHEDITEMKAAFGCTRDRQIRYLVP
jgi:hypothetical protein